MQYSKMPHPARTFGLGLMAMVISVAAASFAQAQTISDGQLARLNANEFEVREAATRELLQDKRLKLDAVVEAYKRAAEPEIRHRLLNVAQHCLVREQMNQNPTNGQQGAIGIRPAGVLPRQLAHCKEPAVVVVSTSVGFPGNAHLQPNDLITHVNGRPLRPSDNVDAIRDEFIGMIETMKPDEMIDLTVNRDGQVQQVRFALANKADLATFYTNTAVGNTPVRLLTPWMEIRRHIESAGERPRTLNFRLPNARRDSGQDTQPKVQADLLSKIDATRNGVTIIKRGGKSSITVRIEGNAGNVGLELTEDLLRQLDAADPDSPNGKRVRDMLRAIQTQIQQDQQQIELKAPE